MKIWIWYKAKVVHARRVNVKSPCLQPPTCIHALAVLLLYPSKYFSYQQLSAGADLDLTARGGIAARAKRAAKILGRGFVTRRQAYIRI